MLGRRALLSLIPGAAAAAATGVTPRDLAGALGGQVPDPAADDFADFADLPQRWNSVGEARCNRRLSQAMSELYKQQNRAVEGPYPMPSSIATKRSWSVAFKESVHRRDLDAWRAIIEHAGQDQAFLEKVADMLGLPS